MVGRRSSTTKSSRWKKRKTSSFHLDGLSTPSISGCRPRWTGGRTRLGEGSLIIASRQIERRRRSYGGTLAKYLLPHVVEREKLVNPNAKGAEAWAWLPPPLIGEGQQSAARMAQRLPARSAPHSAGRRDADAEVQPVRRVKRGNWPTTLPPRTVRRIPTRSPRTTRPVPGPGGCAVCAATGSAARQGDIALDTPARRSTPDRRDEDRDERELLCEVPSRGRL